MNHLRRVVFLYNFRVSKIGKMSSQSFLGMLTDCITPVSKTARAISKFGTGIIIKPEIIFPPPFNR